MKLEQDSLSVVLHSSYLLISIVCMLLNKTPAGLRASGLGNHSLPGCSGRTKAEDRLNT